MDLRHRRLLPMALIPVLLVGLRHLIPDGWDLAVNLAGFTGFLVPMLILAVLLAPSLGWFFGGALLGVLDHPDHRPERTLELHQLRRRIASGQRAEAYQLLASSSSRGQASILPMPLQTPGQPWAGSLGVAQHGSQQGSSLDFANATSNSRTILGRIVGCLFPHGHEQAETRALGRAKVKALRNLLDC